MWQAGLTLITEILPDKVDALKALLHEIGNDINGNAHIDFGLLRSVHFLRFVVLDASEVRGTSIPPQLVLSTNYDGPLHDHLMELATQAQAGLNRIYSHCRQYPPDADPATLAAFLRRHQRKNAAFYMSTMGRSVEQVEQEAALYQAIQDYLQESCPAQNWQGRTATDIRKEIQDFILSQAQFAWAKEPYRKPFLQKYGSWILAGELLAILFLYGILWVVAPLATLLISLVLAVMVFFYWKTLRSLEKSDAATFQPAIKRPDQLAQLTQHEDYKVQNQLTHLVTAKAGRLRLFTLRLILGAINLLAATFYNKGQLAGIVTIHFARWAIIDGGKRLLFFSNFDGSWESYLGEFVDRSAIGLTAVWSNTEGFPPTQRLIQQGARHSVEFKSWAREKQIPTQVWYSARKTLSVKNINNNTAIRAALLGEMNEEEAKAWLRLL